MRIVFKNVVISRNFVSDFGAKLKNIVGGRLKTYEAMLDEGITEATNKLLSEYPNVKDVKMQVTEFSNSSICITVYGVVNNAK